MTSSKLATRWRAVTLLMVATLVAPLLAAAGAVPASANGGTSQNGVVSAVPSASFPNITSGAVEAIAQVGTRMVVGGTFTTVTTPGSSTVLTRKFLLAFNATTGAIDTGFLPVVDGEVDAITAGPTSTSVYVGGRFTNVNGVKSKSLALLNLDDGTTVTSFKVPAFNGIVQDLKVANGRLFVAGTFTVAGPTAHAGLLALKTTTGAVDPFVNLQVSGHHNSTTTGGAVGAVGVVKIDISPNGLRLVAIGNFTQVSGANRDQIVSVDLSGATATVNQGWATNAYTPPCYSWAYDSYMRAVQFSPDGSYFVVVTTGGYYGGSFQACDATARFETTSTGADVQPTWVSYTGTDSLYSVAVTGSAIYVGGHQRWMNNPYGQDSPGAGAVPRAGLAALEPVTGVPMSWNPGRNPRGHGAEALLATPTGLWVGSDTAYIGDYRYNRGRLAYFPLAGGRQIVASNTGALPGKVFLAGRLSVPTAPASVDDVTSRTYDGASAVGQANTLPGTGITWSQARGAFMINGKLFYGWSDGNLYTRTFNGTTFGAAQLIDPYNDPTWSNVQTGSGQTYRGTMTDFSSEIPNVTGMFYANGHIYYTLVGDATLHARAFSPDSGIVGSPASSVDSTLGWADSSGMFLAAGKLYFATRSDGSLHQVAFSNGRPAATAPVVSGPTIDGANWSTAALFLQAS